MRSLLTSYAVFFNRRHDRVGHLFQNRFKSLLCEEEGYFSSLVRYIHLNPVRGGIVAGMDELDHYPWTGHAALMGRRPPGVLDVPEVLAAFGPSEDVARANYRRFVSEGLDAEEVNPLRSGNAWTKVAHRASRARKTVDEARVLGSTRFVAAIQRETEGRHAEDWPGVARAMDVATLVTLVATTCDAGTTGLAAGSKLRPCTRAREGIAYLWLEVIGGPCRALVQSLGVGEPSIYRAAYRGRRRRQHWDDVLRCSLSPSCPPDDTRHLEPPEPDMPGTQERKERPL